MFTMKAWMPDRYISLAGILVTIGPQALNLAWVVVAEEIEPHPKASSLEGIVGENVDLLLVLAACAPDVQIIDGLVSELSRRQQEESVSTSTRRRQHVVGH